MKLESPRLHFGLVHVPYLLSISARESHLHQCYSATHPRTTQSQQPEPFLYHTGFIPPADAPSRRCLNVCRQSCHFLSTFKLNHSSLDCRPTKISIRELISPSIANTASIPPVFCYSPVITTLSSSGLVYLPFLVFVVC